jgi:hypothetical protein
MRGEHIITDERYCDFYYCTDCGATEIQEDFNFCPMCGSPTESCKHPQTFENGTCMDCGINIVNDPRPTCKHLTIDKGICFDCGETINEW